MEFFDELTDVYCQADDSIEKSSVFKSFISKMMSLMSDRAANMKSFN